MQILEVTFQTQALHPMREFYVQVLGLKLAEDEEDYFAVYIGSELLRFNSAKINAAPRYHFAFNIPENQIAEAESWLEERLELLPFHDRNRVDFPDWNAHALYFHDPAGNIVELIARHDLPNAQSEDFGPEAFLNISEVGLAVQSTLSFASGIRGAFDIKVWERSKIAPSFAALGTGERLLIVSRMHRNWLPTAIPALPWPLEIVFAGEKDHCWESPDYPYRFLSRKQP